MKSYKIYIDSAAWMCETNLVGTSRIYRYIIVNNHEITKNPSEADYIIINSCGFSNRREDMSINLFEKYSSMKDKKPTIIMYGCLVKINEELMNSLELYPINSDEGEKFDNIFYKNTKFEDVEPYCDHRTKQNLIPEEENIQPLQILSFFLSGLLVHFSKKVRSNYQYINDNVQYKNKTLIEICRGCTFNCSYCVIKKAIGNVQSRPMKDIISDIEKLYDPAKSLFLVSDDCSCYGLDINTNFFNLLYEINKRFPDSLIELDTLNPYWVERFSNEYIKLFSDVAIGLVTIPVQSGSNKILKNMNRKYDIKKVIKIVKKIKNVSPKTFIYTHIIVGFPGENTIDFLKSLSCALHFDLPVVLPYSEHKDSASSSLPHHKSNLTVSTRYILFMLFLNIVIFAKLFSYRKK